MNKNSVLFFGTLSTEQTEVLNQISQAVWSSESKCCGAGALPLTIEMLPLTGMSGSSPVFLLVGGCTFDEGNPNYKKVSESKNNCRVGVIITEGESQDIYLEDENYPDFFILLEKKEMVILKKTER